MTENRNNGLSIYCDSGVGFYALKPIVEELKAKGAILYIYTLTKSMELASSYLDIPPNQVFDYQKATPTWKRRLDKLIKKVLVKNTFSSQYERINRDGFLISLLQKLPKPASEKINSIYYRIWSALNKKPFFKTKRVLYVTRSGSTLLLNNKHHEVDVLVESWDHPAKSPFFVKCNTVFIWNSELASDTERIQQLKQRFNAHYQIIFPLKFRYLLEDEIEVKNDQLQRDLAFINQYKNSYILYICTYSSFSKNNFFDGEKELISDLIRACEEAGKHLFIKPHPHYHPTDFDYLKSDVVHVGTGASKGGFNYIFTDEDQYYKKQLIQNAERIINVGTTFSLESVFFDKKVIQISLEKGTYGTFWNASQNYHLKNYLNSNDQVMRVSNENRKEQIDKIVKEDVSLSYSQYMKKWVYEADYDASITHIVEHLA